jgi:peptidoglycan DL-endopeptidase CwlO
VRPGRVLVVVGTCLVTVFLSVPLLFGAGQQPAAAAMVPAGTALGGTVAAPLLGAVVRTTVELLPGVPAGGYPDHFPYGQCTYWAALNHRVTWSGNAAQWAANAAAQGIALLAAPAVGAIAVWPPGHGYDAQDGHVAVVTSVSPTSYTVSEMNYLGPGVVDARTIAWPDPRVLGFIP